MENTYVGGNTIKVLSWYDNEWGLEQDVRATFVCDEIKKVCYYERSLKSI